MPTVYLGIGSNVGDKLKNFQEVLERLENVPNLKVISRSAFYVTKPAGGPPQEDYLNGVLGVETDLSAEKLLRSVKNIEKDMGRKKRPRNFPRIIDVDILLYGSEIINTKELVLPHPRMHERDFVLRGFAEIAPEAVHPVIGKTIGELSRMMGNTR
ncbi:MAG: 2-amino-4-hydroxy-6-hydroxymethyldihydropteridine diphosphokinase [Candidatus Omnitrophica bacterium]|nr:2-amino-4-hydroxy-6-hydroxymethyldihydropteridine diphosphokinase [Candidatus Omnitrophota bacterium]